MSALPLALREDVARATILKLYNTTYSLDPYHDRLVSVGYDVIDATAYADALTLAHARQPDLIVVFDDPEAGIDALKWLELQHNDRASWMPVTPLMILADAARVPLLRLEELPDRVVVLQRRADTLNQLTRTVKTLLRVNRWE